MTLDWTPLRAVVIQSDDWGLCAWSPDDEARRALADTPAFRSPAGLAYGGSTLESAADVRGLAGVLEGLRGGDGNAPVLQANTIVAAPDYDALRAAALPIGPLPLREPPELPSRWARPGLWDELRRAVAGGVWWPELHGLHHLPETAWLAALRRGDDDARRALAHQSPVCAAVEAGGEYDPAEPWEVRDRNLTLAAGAFERRFGRPPASLCPPDYRWDDRLEDRAAALGIAALQGKSEQHGAPARRLRRLWHRRRWPRRRGGLLHLPPRIAFEPRLGAPRTGAAAARRAARAAGGRGQPAVLSTHRVNYAHLDADVSSGGRAALGELLAGLCEDGAVFVTDAEIAQLVARGWSRRDVGDRETLLRYHGRPGEPVRLGLPAGASAARIADSRDGEARLEVDGREAEARVNVGCHRIEWSRA